MFQAGLLSRPLTEGKTMEKNMIGLVLGKFNSNWAGFECRPGNHSEQMQQFYFYGKLKIMQYKPPKKC